MSVTMAARPAGIAAALGATTAFSWGFILVKWIGLPAPTISFWRLLIGAATLALVARLAGTRMPPVRGSVLAAGLSFGVHQLLFIQATQMTAVATVTLIASMQPVVVALVSRRLLAEPVSPQLVGYAVLAVAGVGIVVLRNLDAESRSLEGDLLAVANLFAFTAYFLFARRAREEGVSTVPFTAAFLAVGLVVVAPAALLWPADPVEALTLRPVDLGLITLLALVPGNGHLLLNWAHTRISAALSSLVLAAVPVLASVWAHLVFREPYGPAHAIGMVLVIAAIQGAQRFERRAPAVETPPIE